jgi:hypothetical protein
MLDRADFVVYRRNGRELIPVIVPRGSDWFAHFTLVTGDASQPFRKQT